MSLTARHPLRERLWALLMEALHRCGRRGEALDAYHRYRRGLREELGIDPSEAILALHKSILTSSVEAEPEAGAPLSVPRQLPSDTVAFTGRTAELGRLDSLSAAKDASSTPLVCVITGTAGVGKTALAVHWARGVADEFPDGQLFVDLRGYHRDGALPPQRVLARFMRALGARGEDLPEDVDELAAAYRSAVDGRRMLIVLDNAAGSEQVRPLLPGSAGSLVLVTSRDVLLGLIATEGAEHLSLELPTLAEARRLLARRIGPERLAAERSAADDIIAAGARLPLALAIAAAQAVARRDSSLSALAEQLRAGLDAFGAPSTETDVRAVFSWSYRSLGPEAARLLRLLGLHPGPDVSVSAAAGLSGGAPSGTERLLEELVRANLLMERVPGRYALHDLMREYCVELVRAEEAEAERDRAARGLLDQYIRDGHTAAAVLAPQRMSLVPGEVPVVEHSVALADHDAAMRWFAAESEVLLALMDWAVEIGHDRRAWQLAMVLVAHLELQGSWTQWTDSQRLALRAAERLEDPVLAAYAHRGVGRAHARMRRVEDARRHYERALELYRANGDPRGEAIVLTNLSMLHEQQGRYEEALEHAQRALDLERRLGSADKGTTLNLVAWCLAKLGRHESALEYGRQARAEYRRSGDLLGEAAAVDTVGHAHHQMGRFREAIEHYQEAVRMHLRLGDRPYAATCLLSLGDAQQEAGDREAARDSWRRAEAILDELEHPDADQARERLAESSDRPESAAR